MKKLSFLLILVICGFVFGTRSVRAESELEAWCKSQGLNWEIDSETGWSYCRIVPGDVVSFTGTMTIPSMEMLLNDGGIFTNNGFITIDSEGGIGQRSDSFFYNNGTINNFGPRFYTYGNFTNKGVINIENEGEFFIDVVTFNNSGTINNFGPNFDQQGGTFNNSGTINNVGTFRIRIQSVFNNYGTIQNHALINILSATIANFSTINNFDIIDNGGRLENKSDGTINNYILIRNRETIINDGTINNICEGRISPIGEINNNGIINDIECVPRALIPMVVK
jgi:hypothetical protein